MAMAGIIKHAPELTYYLNCTENSYDRLGEHKAPHYIAWGHENRSTFIRVPATKGSPRIEIRSADCGCNSYLAFTLLIYAALDGIKNQLVPPPAVTENLFGKENPSLEKLPDTLDCAKKIAEASDFIKKVLSF